MRGNEFYQRYEKTTISDEVRIFLRENKREIDRQHSKEFQYRVAPHAFDAEKTRKKNGEKYTCDPFYFQTGTRSESAERTFFRKEAKRAFVKALNRLSMDQSQRLVLHFFHELSFTEIARREGVTEGAVRHQMERSVAALRKELCEQGWSLKDFRQSSMYDYLAYPTRNTMRNRAKKNNDRAFTKKGSGGRKAA